MARIVNTAVGEACQRYATNIRKGWGYTEEPENFVNAREDQRGKHDTWENRTEAV